MTGLAATLSPHGRALAHHPEEELLVRFAGGDLTLGRRAVIEGHLAFCPDCRREVAELAHPGGRHLASASSLLPPLGLWEKIARRLAVPAEPRAANPLTETPLPPGVIAELPERVQPLEWNTMTGTPIQLCHLWRDEALGLDLILLQGPPRSTFPYHRHLGTEDLLLLQGGLEDQHAHLQAGEIFTYPQGTEHEPLLDAGQTCWALTAIAGGVDFTRA